MTARALLALFVATSVLATANGAAETRTDAMPDRERYRQLADETEAAFRRHVIGVWFPTCVDREHGGFRCDFTADWKAAPSNTGKFSVFQARMTWITAEASRRRADLKDRLLPITGHGAAFLKDHLWDNDRGGFYWGVNDDGSISSEYTDAKVLYGISFCIYGAAASHRATGDADALKLAQDGFRWVDQHARDSTNGGYIEYLTRDGKPIEPDPNAREPQKVPVAGFPVGQKSMNTHIHLLEALTELYQVWPDPVLRERFESLRDVVRDRICLEPGAMNLYFTNDWRPTSDRDSYGHDVETAFLLLEASEALGQPDDAKTQRMAKMLVDHSLAAGWDDEHGGFYREGKMLASEADDTAKDWWVQFEGLNALLMMHELYGKDDPRYFRAFEKQWRFIVDHQTDHERGGFYEQCARDGKVVRAAKAQRWKEGYHDGRALLNVTDRLRKLAGRAN